ncbi:hypothetical protein [Actinomadura sp. WMMB 499]|uniref:hypothetical protein n=1 Tax=Actinomadura sp. WMMB 499 TaxID=1219491 RepID=UPI0012457666|nr:hypothetical protein [Actinomadura sp. WMMB 499]QFG23972.1 hypothetical protein F7P10_25455 [Actinomadura sp. WMMB 499]
MNIDFGADATFSWYVVLLLLSGPLILLAAAITDEGIWARIAYAAAGLAMLGYGVYLGFIFTGGEYYMFFYVFILPIAVVFRVAASLIGVRRATT